MERNGKVKILKDSIRHLLQEQELRHRTQAETRINQEINEKILRLSSSSTSHDSIDKIHQDAIFSTTKMSDSTSSSHIHPLIESDEARKPLYQVLKVNDLVFSRYSDGKYYQAVIKSVTHGGYPSALYDIEYLNYSNERQTVSWKHLLPSLSEDKESEETMSSLNGNKRRRLSSDPSKDEYGRDRRNHSVRQSASQEVPQCDSIADISPALLNRPKGAWKKK